MNAIEVVGVSKTFEHDGRPRQILKDISFTSRAGEILGLFGPSGCGKTTLLRIISGVTDEDDGEVRIFGAASRCGMTAYVPQRGALLDWKTLRENALLGWTVMRGRPSEEILSRADSLLARFGIAAVADHYPQQSSGGERQRSAFARAILTPARIIALDEPVGAIDHITRLNMYDEMLSVVSEQDPPKTVLVVSHDPEELLTLCDRVLVMSGQPASIRAEIHIPFQRPREELKYTPEFATLSRTLWRTLS
jgi:ABC-type nitrate/sulfonate/bicarbonate transport system ATPase subunit